MEMQNKINSLEDRLKKANVKELLLKTKIAGASKGSRDSCSTKGSDTEDSAQENKPEKGEIELNEMKEHVNIDSDEDCVEVIETTPEAETIICDDDVKEGEATTQEQVHKPPILSKDIELKLISLSTAYLMIQPHGASLVNLWSYINQFSLAIQPEMISQVLKSNQSLFVEGGNGMWKFVGFDVKIENEQKEEKKENGEVKHD